MSLNLMPTLWTDRDTAMALMSLEYWLELVLPLQKNLIKASIIQILIMMDLKYDPA